MKISNEAKIGIVVFLAAIVFVAGIIYLRGIDFRKKEYSLVIYYNNVNGLTEGSPITIAGLSIGKVKELKLVGTAIAVEVAIENDVHISRDSKAFIKSSSLMGGKLIAIQPGFSGHSLQNGDTLTGAYEADLTELTSTLSPISTNVLGILERVNTTFDERTRRSIQNILLDFSKSTAELQSIIKEQGTHLDYAVGNFATFSIVLSRFASRLDSIAVSQSDNIDVSLSHIRQTTEDIRKISEYMKSTSKSLDDIVGRLDRGEGTLGKLSKDERLYNHIDSLAYNLNELVKDFKANPKRYVSVSVF